MPIKKFLITSSIVIPMLLMYLFPIDKSIYGKGILMPAHSAEILAPLSGPLRIEHFTDANAIKDGEKLFEIAYSSDQDLLAFGMRQSHIEKLNNDLDSLKRKKDALKNFENGIFNKEKQDIDEEVAKKNSLENDLLQPWEYFQFTDKAAAILAPHDGSLVRKADDPLNGEIVSAGQHLASFVTGNELRIIVLYPLDLLPDINASKDPVEIKVANPEGRLILLRGEPLTEPIMGGELWRLLRASNNYLMSVATKENKAYLQKSFGVLYEIKTVPVNAHLLFDQEVTACIKRPRSTLISLWFGYARLNWHVFTHDFFKEPLVAVQCLFAFVNFYIFLPFIPITFYFAGKTPWEIRKRYLESLDAHVPIRPLRVSVIVPYFNEGKTVLSTIDSLARQEYPVEHFILVDDGSADDSFSIIRNKFKLKLRTAKSFPRPKIELKEHGAIRDIHAFSYLGKSFILIRKENAGKGYALNCALNLIDSDYAVTLDGDTILDPDSLVILLYSVYKDPQIKAAHGRLGVMNNCVVKDGVVVKKSLPRTFLEMNQVVEYFGFGLSKAFHNALGSHTVIIGAFACYEIKMLRQIGGFYHRTIVEDQDVAYEIQKRTAGTFNKSNIIYVPQAVAWTQVPFTLSGLFRQRSRWAGGSLETLIKHQGMIFNPKTGWVGMYFMPMMWFGNIMFWLSLPINLYGIVGLGINIFLFVSSSVWRGLLHYYFLYFFIPGLLLNIFGTCYDYWFVDSKYIKSWNNVQKIIMVLFLQVGPVFYGYIVSYYRLIGQMKALMKKLTWGTIERKSVRE